MKRIILIVLILANFFILGLIILKKYDNYQIEQFYTPPFEKTLQIEKIGELQIAYIHINTIQFKKQYIKLGVNFYIGLVKNYNKLYIRPDNTTGKVECEGCDKNGVIYEYLEDTDEWPYRSFYAKVFLFGGKIITEKSSDKLISIIKEEASSRKADAEAGGGGGGSTSSAAVTSSASTSSATVTTSTCDDLSPTQACISDIFTYSSKYSKLTQGSLKPEVKHVYIYDENNEIKPTSDCNEYDCECDKGECCDDIENNDSHCIKKTTIRYYDTINSNTSDLLLVPNTLDTVHNFNLVFFFILPSIDPQTTAASIPVKKYIVTSQTNLWSLYTNGSNLFIDTNNSSKSDGERESYQITDQLKPLKEYQVDLKITKSDITVNITDGKNNHSFDIKFNKQICFSSMPCKNKGIHEYFDCYGKIRNKKCDFKVIKSNVGNPSSIIIDKYYFGTNIHSETYEYSNIFIGEIIKSGKPPNLVCDFYGEDYKTEGSGPPLKSGGKEACLKDCNTNSSCSSNNCYNKCNNVTVCDFQAVGRHEIDCIQHCVKNNNCEAIDCKTICEDKTASWVVAKPNEFDSQYFDPEGKPSSVIVVLINVSTDGTKATISWRPPYPGKLPVKGYISYLYKTFKKSEAVKINKINNLNCIDKCEFVIKELTPGETYTVSIKAYNDIGLGKMSNLLTFKSSVMSLNLDMRIEEEIDEHSVGDFKYCDVN